MMPHKSTYSKSMQKRMAMMTPAQMKKHMASSAMKGPTKKRKKK